MTIYYEDRLLKTWFLTVFACASSRSDTLFESIASNSLGLDPETRLFFLQVFERHPDLNLAEKRLLARSARVDTDVVEAFCKSILQLYSISELFHAYLGLRIPRSFS